LTINDGAIIDRVSTLISFLPSWPWRPSWQPWAWRPWRPSWQP